MVTRFDPEPDIALEAKEALYRIAQEAMHNVVKHAHATRVELTLEERDGKLTLEIRDNGKGFDTEPRISWSSWHEDPCLSVPAQIGGEFQIQSQSSEGTIDYSATVKVIDKHLPKTPLKQWAFLISNHQAKVGRPSPS